MKPCNDCPFMKSSPLAGAPDWLQDVMMMHAKDEFFSHTCHKTDPNADGYVGGKKKRECKGHLMMIMNDFDKTPGKDGTYDSIEELIETYLRHWLPNGGYEEMKAKYVPRGTKLKIGMRK